MKRYDIEVPEEYPFFNPLVESEDGDYVLYTEIERLERELDERRYSIESERQAQAEIERLEKDLAVWMRRKYSCRGRSHPAVTLMR